MVSKDFMTLGLMAAGAYLFLRKRAAPLGAATPAQIVKPVYMVSATRPDLTSVAAEGGGPGAFLQDPNILVLRQERAETLAGQTYATLEEAERAANERLAQISAETGADVTGLLTSPFGTALTGIISTFQRTGSIEEVRRAAAEEFELRQQLIREAAERERQIKIARAAQLEPAAVAAADIIRAEKLALPEVYEAPPAQPPPPPTEPFWEEVAESISFENIFSIFGSR